MKHTPSQRLFWPTPYRPRHRAFVTGGGSRRVCTTSSAGCRRRLPPLAPGFVTGVLADISRRLSKPFAHELLGLRTARRGDCRVLFTLDLEEHVEHRADVYKPPQPPRAPRVYPAGKWAVSRREFGPCCCAVAA